MMINKTKYIHVDTGGGEYDHHETEEYVCASSLVMKDYLLDGDNIVKKMVDYCLKVDHGKLFDTDVSDFDILNIIQCLNSKYNKQPYKVIKAILDCLDGVYVSLRQKEQAEAEIENPITFQTVWGTGAAIESSNKKTRYLAHRMGYKVFLYIDPQKGFRGFTADGRSSVDFNSLYKKIIAMEPQADWFLHSSKQLLLCGFSKAPFKRLSKLTLQEMIKFIEV